MKNKCLLFIVLLIISTLTYSCTSNNSDNATSNESSFSKLIIGKWGLNGTSKCSDYISFGTLTTGMYQIVYETCSNVPKYDDGEYEIKGDRMYRKSYGGMIVNPTTIISITETTLVLKRDNMDTQEIYTKFK
ncbi:hypothetical protein [Flavobacterium sp. AJR]|uniref:hypothetical protein n=1 Tax=Flavobacterium sp. AJR TaxID=1979369 RepID=UPI000A3D8427|nr:hypothetical protein [Flavobacterium sp. AJR]OUL60989.1 hypothetical protein B8T70_17735 [Flavobacterium sp. AJR]